MSPKEALAFVKRHGVVLQSAHGAVPNLAEAVAGGRIRGSWWGHPRGKEIFRATEAICDHPEVLVCTWVDGKVTYVHRRLWPALIKLAPRLRKEQLARVRNEHTPSGAHRSRKEPFPGWVPADITREAGELSESEAEAILSPWLAVKGSGAFSIDDHFEGKTAAVREIYHRLLAALRKIGPVQEEPKKTSIHLVRSTALAGVEVRKEYILLNIKTDYAIPSPRVVKREQLSARRFHHKIKLASPREVDAEVRRWLKDAYELSG